VRSQTGKRAEEAEPRSRTLRSLSSPSASFSLIPIAGRRETKLNCDVPRARALPAPAHWLPLYPARRGAGGSRFQGAVARSGEENQIAPEVRLEEAPPRHAASHRGPDLPRLSPTGSWSAREFAGARCWHAPSPPSRAHRAAQAKPESRSARNHGAFAHDQRGETINCLVRPRQNGRLGTDCRRCCADTWPGPRLDPAAVVRRRNCASC